MNFRNSLLAAIALFSVSISASAGSCVPLDPSMSFLAATCNLNQSPSNCTGVCTWQSENGEWNTNFCVPLDPSQTFLAATCNLNHTPDNCIGVCTWVGPRDRR